MQIEKKHSPEKICDKKPQCASISTTTDEENLSCTEDIPYSSRVVKSMKWNAMCSYISFDVLLNYVAAEPETLKKYNELNSTCKKPQSLRLCGGGEQALNSGTSGWGSPPAGGSMGNLSGNNTTWSSSNQQNPQQWGNTTNQNIPQNVQQNPTQSNIVASQPHRAGTDQITNSNKSQTQMANNISGQQPQAQSGGNIANGNNINWNTQANASNVAHHPPNLPIAGGNNNFGVPINNNTNNISNPVAVPTTIATKNQLEQLNTMRESLFSQDGWGCQHVNQDTNWDVPGSPDASGGNSNIIKTDASGQSIPGTNNPGSTTWKQNINNGTELWEANLRNGGQPAPPAIQKTPWGHTPSNNLGGTWGEDDDGIETANVWTGSSTQQWNQSNVNTTGAAPSNNSSNTAASNLWPTSPNIANNSGNSSNILVNNTHGSAAHSNVPNIPNPSIKKDGEWSSNTINPVNANTNWGDSREIRASNSSIDVRNGEQRDIRLADPREQMRDMRGDPRGISGRLNSNEMWGQHHNIPHQQQPQLQPQQQQPNNPPPTSQNQSQAQQHSQIGINKMVGPGASGGALGQWAPGTINNQPKDLPIQQHKSSGWEEPSPPTQRRNMPNFDDGTSLWGQQQPQSVSLQQSRVPAHPAGTHWKEDIARSGMRNPVNAAQNPNSGIVGSSAQQPRPGPNTKADNLLWNHNTGMNTNRNPSWEENSQNWDDKNIAPGTNVANSWGEAHNSNVWAQQQKQKHMNTVGPNNIGWPEPESADWSSNAHLQKPQSIKMAVMDKIRNSKQYRVLFEMGFKKEDIELALHATTLNLEEAIEILNQSRGSNTMENWRRHEDQHNFEHGNFAQRYPTAQQPSLAFVQGNNQSILPNMGVPGPNSNANITSMPQIQPQKFINPGVHNASLANSNIPGNFNQCISGISQSINPVGNSGPVNAAVQPSTQQLRMLVQQIQMAVQAGYLNHQILNQPLAPTTLVLLNQLLSHIKQLQVTTANINRGGNNLQMSVTITKLKQQIGNLQNQIAAQQALYVKQQQSGGNQNAANGSVGNINFGLGVSSNMALGNITAIANSGLPPNNDYTRGQHDQITLPATFADMSITKEQQSSFQNNGQQSRLNQWKLPNLEKDSSDAGTDFSRAPGTTAKNTISTSNSVIGSLQGEGTWSSGRNINDGWPDSASESEHKEWPPSQQSPAAASAFSDLVPEFEPGKPWKGSQIKAIEDDPSITPGSVARSPLSISTSTTKESELFASSSKTSPTELPPLSLSSSTWSFNPSASNVQPNFTSAIGKINTPKTSSWSEGSIQPSSNSSELWGVPLPSKSARGPPPGLGVSSNKGTAASNTAASSTTGGNCNGWIGGSLPGRIEGSNNSNWTNNNNNNNNNSNTSWPSSWLLLKNLTAQIDGSTLRTLCIQHGPLQHFHLYLNHGIALCKYASHEESNKAQMALNNCVLGNTTICAESPSESEVQNILQHLGVPSSSAQGQGPHQIQQHQHQSQPQQQRSLQQQQQQVITSTSQSQWRPSQQGVNTRPSGPETWAPNSSWPNTSNSGASLWTPLEGSSERGTPSSLNSFLPENLLGNEIN